MKKIIITIVLFLFVCLNLTSFKSVNATTNTNQLDLAKNSKSAILIEATTNKILYEKNSNEKLPPASMTKILTIKLIMDAISSGNINNEDLVITSKKASSIDGSRIFLSLDEQMKVSDLLKSVIIASANDAAVAMAEFVAGSEEAFVVQMNERAQELGMVDTQFVNACGLDADGHVSSAYDIALMSRELMREFPEIQEFTTTWQDSIIHSTKRGDSEFGLTNTNKLIQWYPDTTGLKTGSTGKALYCFSGTAERNDMRLVAAIMAAPDYKVRFQEAMTLLDYGFNNFIVEKGYEVGYEMGRIPVEKGSVDEVKAIVAEEISVLLPKSENAEWDTKINLLPIVKAPVEKDAKIGELIYLLEGKTVGKSDLIAANEVTKAGLQEMLEKMLVNWC